MKREWGKTFRLVMLPLIPVLALAYIGYVNLLPFGSTTTYFIDIGGNDTAGDAQLIGPWDRVSDRRERDGTSFRELEKWGVYFELKSPKLGDASDISVRVRFKDNFPQEQRFILGARNKREWSYNWRDIYIPFYRELAGLPLVVENKAIKIYSIGNQQHAEFENVEDFLESPPLYSTIATNNPSLVNQGASPENWGEIESSEFPGEEEGMPLIIRTALRGAHTFWTYVSNGLLELKLIKQDLNWYEGADGLKIEIYSLEGELRGEVTIPDDGEEGKTTQPGPLQSKILRLAGLEEGVYRIEFKSENDLLIRRIEVNQEKFVVEKKLYWAGMNPVYFQQALLLSQASLYFRNTAPSRIRFSTAHTAGLQSITILNSNFHTVIDIDKTHTWFETRLEPGVYKLTSEKQDIIIESGNYFAFTPGSFFIPKRCEVVSLKQDLSWLRENVDFVVVDYSDYREPADDNGWMIAKAEWKVEEVLVDDNKLNFCFNVPHLNKEQYQDRTIPIDWIEIKVNIPPIWKR
jgi:hypothetical protein